MVEGSGVPKSLAITGRVTLADRNQLPESCQNQSQSTNAWFDKLTTRGKNIVRAELPVSKESIIYYAIPVQ